MAQTDTNVRDPHFLGQKQVTVSDCTRTSCKVALGTSLLPDIPLVTERYVMRNGKIQAPKGVIYKFLFTDALLDCMGHFADTQDARALAPCLQ